MRTRRPEGRRTPPVILQLLKAMVVIEVVEVLGKRRGIGGRKKEEQRSFGI